MASDHETAEQYQAVLDAARVAYGDAPELTALQLHAWRDPMLLVLGEYRPECLCGFKGRSEVSPERARRQDCLREVAEVESARNAWETRRAGGQ
jgi:hypothetical protein